jgi:putative tryptophan/tyrosine transport system substrate-binding protein
MHRTAKSYERRIGSMRYRLVVTILLCSLALVVVPSAWAQTKSVFVLGTERDAATEAMGDGLRDALKAVGFIEGRNLKMLVETVVDDEQRLSQQALNLVLGRPDVLVALSIPAAQALMRHTKQMPIVFVGVTDPVQAELVPSWSASGTNVTGVSDLLTMARRVQLIRQFVPQARRIGVVFNPVDAASVIVIREFQEQLTKAGMLMVEVAALRALDVAAASRSLIGKVDAMHTFWDSHTQAAYPGLVKVANDSKIALLAADTVSVQAGALAALVVTERDVGATAGRQVIRILRGTKPGAIAPEVVSRPQVQINLVAAKKQGVSLPDSLLKTTTVIVKE